MHKFNTHMAISAIMAMTLLLAAALSMGSMSIQPVYAQLFDEGADEFAPGQIIGPDAPGLTDESAPGKIIGPDSPKENSPGQQGLDLGIIGPPKKLE